MKLCLFMTPNGALGIAATKRSPKDFEDIYESGYIDELCLMIRRPPKGFPPLNPGECIPVELVPVGKKARKV